MLWSTPEFIFKIVIIGPSLVGKTCFIHRYTDKVFLGDTKKTIGLDFALKKMNVSIDKNKQIVRPVTLQLWDFAGETEFDRLLPYYLHGTSILLLAFDTTRIETLHALTYWMPVTRGIIPSVPIFLVSMKNDLEITVSDEAIELFRRKEGVYQVFRTSSKTGKNVDAVFQGCIDYITNRYILKVNYPSPHPSERVKELVE